MKKNLFNPGDLLVIPYEGQLNCYGRVLKEGNIALYDYIGTSVINVEILSLEILFIAHVNFSSMKASGWKVLKNIPLEDNLASFSPIYFNPSPFDIGNISFYESHKDAIEDAIKKDWIKTGKLQLDGCHNHEHIISRIKDYYGGNMNYYNNSSIQFFKSLLP